MNIMYLKLQWIHTDTDCLRCYLSLMEFAKKQKKTRMADAAHKEDRIRVWDYSTGDRKAVCGRED